MASQDHSLATNIGFVAWNYNKGSGPGRYADIRDTITPLVYKNISRNIVFISEITTKDETTRKKLNLPETFNLHSHPESVSTRNAIVSPPNIKVTPTEASKRYGRYSSMLMETGDVQYIGVTYHGESQPDDKAKAESLRKFISDMINLAKTKKQIVIVGGDFNYEVYKWKREMEAEFEGSIVVAPLYQSLRRNVYRVIDTFIAVYPINPKYDVTFSVPVPIFPLPVIGYSGGEDTKLVDYPEDSPWCKVLHYSKADIAKLNSKLKYLEDDDTPIGDEELYKAQLIQLWPYSKFLPLMDHDPILVDVTFTSTSKPSLTFKLEETDDSVPDKVPPSGKEEALVEDIAQGIKDMEINQKA